MAVVVVVMRRVVWIVVRRMSRVMGRRRGAVRVVQRRRYDAVGTPGIEYSAIEVAMIVAWTAPIKVITPVPYAAVVDYVGYKNAAPNNGCGCAYAWCRSVYNAWRIAGHDDDIGIGCSNRNIAVFIGNNFNFFAVLKIAGVFGFFAQILDGCENSIVLIYEGDAYFLGPSHIVAHLL